MGSVWGIIIGATLIALNALVLGQELSAWRAASAGTATTYPLASTLTLLLAIAYTAVATTRHVQARRKLK